MNRTRSNPNYAPVTATILQGLYNVRAPMMAQVKKLGREDKEFMLALATVMKIVLSAAVAGMPDATIFSSELPRNDAIVSRVAAHLELLGYDVTVIRRTMYVVFDQFLINRNLNSN